MLEAANVIVDPVYEALRYGTSLAQMSRSSFGSISESPCHKVGKCRQKPNGVTPPPGPFAHADTNHSKHHGNQRAYHLITTGGEAAGETGKPADRRGGANPRK